MLIHAAGAPLTGIDAERETFVTFADLEAALRRRLDQDAFDAVIHLAAVSDYSVAAVEIDGRTYCSETCAKECTDERCVCQPCDCAKV